MIERIKKHINSKVFIIILILLLICSTFLVGTYAWFTWNSSNNTKLVMSIGSIGEVIFNEGNDINGELFPVYNYADGLSTDFTIENKYNSNVLISFDVKFNITSIADELVGEDVKWAFCVGEMLVGSGDLSTASDGSSIKLYSGSMPRNISSYTFYIYIDANMENDSNMIGKTIIGNIMVEANEQSVNLLEHINSLYINGNQKIITTNSFLNSYYSYQDEAKTWGLMNDNTVLQDDEDIFAPSNAGNIRYFGPTDKVNNYIYFNCDDYSNQSSSTCERWRIIGIVDGKVKIIREESIGKLAWDFDKNQNSNATSYSNNWETSSLQLFLNGLYYDRGTTVTHDYFSMRNEILTTQINLEAIGINDATRNLISESTWYLGGYTDGLPYANRDILYISERVNFECEIKIGSCLNGRPMGYPYSLNAYVGLPYMSDYAYADDMTKCSSPFSSQAGCIASNWMRLYAGWSLSPWPTNNREVYSLFSDNRIVSELPIYPIDVYPTVYLDPDLIIKNGNGSSERPYQISHITPLSDFEYYLGSEVSTITDVNRCYDLNGHYTNGCFLYEPINVKKNEVLLVDYIGENNNVYIPKHYIVDGVTYDVVLVNSESLADFLGYAFFGLFYLDEIVTSVIFEEGVKFYVSTYTGGLDVFFAATPNLTEVPYIPSGIVSMDYSFKNCTNLMGTIRINSSDVTSANGMFDNTINPIIVEVPAGSVTYDTFINAGFPSNVTIKTFDVN